MSTKLAKMVADFRTTLATEIAVGGVGGTLQSYTDDDGVALPNGIYFFTIDGSSTKKEHIVCTLTAGVMSLISSISRQGVQTSGCARKHRIGASVEITDFAHIMYLNDLLRGVTDLDASTPLKYDGTATISDSNALATKAYVDGVAVAGAPDASTTVKGLSEESTAAEINADTAAGSVARLFVNPSTLATSKYGRGLAAFGGYAADAGSTDAYAITLSPVIAAYTVGQAITFKAATRNTGPATLNINSVGAQAIVKDVDQPLDTGDIRAGAMVTVVWDGTNFQMISRSGPVPTGVCIPNAGRTVPNGYLAAEGAAVSRTTYAALFAVLCPTIGTFTVTIATPGVVTLTAHGLRTGDAVYLTTTGALPTGLSVNTRYWVIRVTDDTFRLAASLADALAPTPIDTSGSQSGVHTAVGCPYGVGDGTTTFNLPSMKGLIPVGLDTTQTEFAGLGQTGGEKTHALTVGELAAHTHTFASSTSASSGSVIDSTATLATGEVTTTSSTGSGTGHNNIQPYITMPYIIKI